MTKEKPNLTDVPETMLWTLHNRASEAMRADGIIKDDKAIEIYQSIDYDYQRSFGKPEPSHAVRSLAFDKQIKQFLDQYPNGTIVNLGEGLETQRFRLGNNKALWISIDLEDAIKIRERFIQPDDRHLHLSISATDRKWFDVVPKDQPVFISAQGLFMYFNEEDIKSLIQDIDKTFKHYYIMFDTVPKWLSNKTTSQKGAFKTKYYKVPQIPWGIDCHKIQETFQDWLPKHAIITNLGYSTFPRGNTKWLQLISSQIPILKKFFPSIVKIESHK